MMASVWIKIFGLSALLLNVSQAVKQIRADEAKETPVAFIRISESALTKLIDQEISRESPVDDYFRGTHVVGKAQTTGRPRILLQDNEKVALFQVDLTGTTNSRTVGSHPPVTAYSHASTTFTATKRIEFTAGKGFHDLPATIRSKTVTQVDRITTPRRGLLGRIILNQAWKEAKSTQVEASDFAGRNAETSIVAAFESTMKEKLTKLNNAVDLGIYVKDFGRTQIPPVYQCSTRGGYLQIALSSKSSAQGGVEIPKMTSDSPPIQVGLHKSFFGSPRDLDSVAKLGNMVLGKFGATSHQVFKQPISLLPTLASAIQPPSSTETVHLTADAPQWAIIEDWVVIQFSGNQLGQWLERQQSSPPQFEMVSR